MLIRKFVGLAAGLGATVALGLSVQPAAAHVVGAAPATGTTNNITPSSECLAALQDLRAAIVSDRQADAEEGAGADPAEDANERAHIQQLIANLRRACAAQIAAVKPAVTQTITPTRPVLSSQCAAAVHAWTSYVKSLASQGTTPSAAQHAQLRQLGQAVRAACGMAAPDWSSLGSWSGR